MKTVSRKLFAVAMFALGLTAAPMRAADVEKLLSLVRVWMPR